MAAQSCASRRSSSRFASYPCIGRSASRLSKTRSGVVRSRALDAAILRLPQAAPIPPLALPGGKQGIARLRYSRGEDVEAADVLPLPCCTAKTLVEARGLLPCELGNIADTEKFEVPERSGSY